MRAGRVHTLPVYGVCAGWGRFGVLHQKGNRRVHPRDARPAFRLAGFAELPVTGDHTEAVSSLPAHADHSDSFDRLMVAQALHERMPLLTADPKIWR